MTQIIKILFLSTAIASAGGMFSVGHKNFGLTVGQDSAYGNEYTVLGVSANYFIVDNLSFGASYSQWLGNDPSIGQVTVPATYYIPLSSPFRPYVGGFYSHTFMGDDGQGNSYNDYDSYGGRVGVSMMTSGSSYVSVGWVQEVSDNGTNSQSRGYPEFSGGISF
jgi:outer membrane protein W